MNIHEVSVNNWWKKLCWLVKLATRIAEDFVLLQGSNQWRILNISSIPLLIITIQLPVQFLILWKKRLISSMWTNIAGTKFDCAAGRQAIFCWRCWVSEVRSVIAPWLPETLNPFGLIWSWKILNWSTKPSRSWPAFAMGSSSLSGPFNVSFWRRDWKLIPILIMIVIVILILILIMILILIPISISTMILWHEKRIVWIVIHDS